MDTNNKNDKQYLFDNPKNVKRILYLLYACCTLLVVLDFVIHRHVYHSWENLPLFYPIYGFVGCVILVLIARWMRTFLMRPEDYYDKDDDQSCDSLEIRHSDNLDQRHNGGHRDIGDKNYLKITADEHTVLGETRLAKNNKIGEHHVDA